MDLADPWFKAPLSLVSGPPPSTTFRDPLPHIKSNQGYPAANYRMFLAFRLDEKGNNFFFHNLG
jgi:hypothetical protein